MAAGLPAERRSASPSRRVDRHRAWQALPREMLHQAEEKRQIGGLHPLLVEGQDEPAALGHQAEVGVLDPFGDAAQAEQRPQRRSRQGSAASCRRSATSV